MISNGNSKLKFAFLGFGLILLIAVTAYFLVFSGQPKESLKANISKIGIEYYVSNIFEKNAKPFPKLSGKPVAVLSGFGIVTDPKKDEKILHSIYAELKSLENRAESKADKSFLKTIEMLIFLDLNIVDLYKTNTFKQLEQMFANLDDINSVCDMSNIGALSRTSTLFTKVAEFGKEVSEGYAKYPEIYKSIASEDAYLLKKYASYANTLEIIQKNFSLLCKTYIEVNEEISSLNSEKLQALCSSGSLKAKASEIEAKLSEINKQIADIETSFKELPDDLLNAFGYKESKLKKLLVSVSLLSEFSSALKSGLLCK